MQKENTQRQISVESRQIFISCVIPVLNENALIKDFLSQLRVELEKFTDRFEMIVVDDGSTDNTAEVVEIISLESPVKLVSFSRNFGKELAIAAGLQYCSGDVAILLDADFQHPLEYIQKFITHWAQGYDMVYGLRNDRENETFLKRTFTNLFYRVLNDLSEVRIPPNAGDFRLMDRKIIDSLNQCRERSRFNKGLYAWVGFNSIGIPFKAVDRKVGKSRWHFRRLAELAINGFLSFSDVPLRVCSVVGVLVSVLSIVYGLYIVIDTLVSGTNLPGFPTLITAILFLGGIQLISIGILGEYVARVFNEVKDRPPYIIRKLVGLHSKDEKYHSVR